MTRVSAGRVASVFQPFWAETWRLGADAAAVSTSTARNQRVQDRRQGDTQQLIWTNQNQQRKDFDAVERSFDIALVSWQARRRVP